MDRSQLHIKFQAEAVDGHVISAKLLGCFIFFGKVIKGVSGKSAEGLPVFTDIFVCVCVPDCVYQQYVGFRECIQNCPDQNIPQL